jgi:hypothetical protein
MALHPTTLPIAGIADFNSLQFNCQHCQFNSIRGIRRAEYLPRRQAA